MHVELLLVRGMREGGWNRGEKGGEFLFVYFNIVPPGRCSLIISILSFPARPHPVRICDHAPQATVPREGI